MHIAAVVLFSVSLTAGLGGLGLTVRQLLRVLSVRRGHTGLLLDLGGADDKAPRAPAPPGLIDIGDLIVGLAPTWPVVVLLLIAIVSGSAGNFAAL